MERNTKKPKILGRSRDLTQKEREELCYRSLERIRGTLDALDEWQKSSLNSLFRY